MGLDQHLTRTLSVKNYNFTKPEDRFEIAVAKGTRVLDASAVAEITFDEMYWRKANAIHRWFVERVQGGKDDCGRYYVSTEQLATLRDACTQVLAVANVVSGPIVNGYTFDHGHKKNNYEDGEYIENAQEVAELLPTQEGFFFGGTDYDQYYIGHIKETRDKLDAILANPERQDGDFYYQSSW